MSLKKLTNKQILENILLQLISIKSKNKNDFLLAKKRFAGSFGIKPPTNSTILQVYHKLLKKTSIKNNELLESWLKTREVRTISGVSILTVLTKPFPCPGKCVYCPTEDRMPKSYVASEPAAARSLRHNFDPFENVKARIELLEKNGHSTDKIEMITKGGTWSSYPEWYQVWFVGRCFDACNSTGTQIKPRMPKEEPTKITREELKILWSKLFDAQKINEKKGKHKIIGLTMETRPDWTSPEEIYRLRLLGCTRIELGLQHTDNKILSLIKRGHTLENFIHAVSLSRFAGFKVDFHTMPQLPGTTPKKDLQMYKELYANPGLRPDMIKIYPCVVLPSAEIASWYKSGKYIPYSFKELFGTLLEAKKLTPRYVRIARLIRDIPSTEIIGGNEVTNLREGLQKKLLELGETCNCLRCREVGRQAKLNPALTTTKPTLFVDKFASSGGTEYFISFEDKARKAVFGFCRFRINKLSLEEKDIKNKKNYLTEKEKNEIIAFLPEIKNAGIIRELHTYGQLVPIGTRLKKATQHKGIGTKLVKEAETIAKKEGCASVAIISGIGVRQYYQKLGYKLSGTYMIKKL